MWPRLFRIQKAHSAHGSPLIRADSEAVYKPFCIIFERTPKLRISSSAMPPIYLVKRNVDSKLARIAAKLINFDEKVVSATHWALVVGNRHYHIEVLVEEFEVAEPIMGLTHEEVAPMVEWKCLNGRPPTHFPAGYTRMDEWDIDNAARHIISTWV